MLTCRVKHVIILLMKKTLPVISAVVFLILVLSGFIGYRFFMIRPMRTAWKPLECNRCNVIRITESVWKGNIQAQPDKMWEIADSVGTKTLPPGGQWSMEIASASEDAITLQFTGTIYQDLLPVTHPVILRKWGKATFDTGTVGGGTQWDIQYFQKDE
jgi:hypothetical protein